MFTFRIVGLHSMESNILYRANEGHAFVYVWAHPVPPVSGVEIVNYSVMGSSLAGSLGGTGESLPCCNNVV